MKLTIRTIGLLCTIFLLFSSCDEICDCEDPNTCSLSYGGVAFTPTGEGTFIIQPTFENNPPPEGTYSVDKEGLDINNETGEIDVNNSTSNEYTITFTSDDGATTCNTSIFIDEVPFVVTDCILNYSKQSFSIGVDNRFQRPVFGEEVPADPAKGTFTAVPDGLSIENGIIDLESSEAGQLYTITYTSDDGTIVCSTTVLIEGIDYLDAIYDFDTLYAEEINEQNPDIRVISSPEAAPVLNAEIEGNTGIPGIYDEDGSAREEGLAINPENGIIDVKQTLRNQVQKEEPVESGFSKRFEFTYRQRQEEPVKTIEVEIFLYRTFDDLKRLDPEILDVLLGKQEYPQGKLLERPPYMIGMGQPFD